MIATAWNIRYENEASPTTGVEDEPHTHRFMIFGKRYEHIRTPPHILVQSKDVES